MLYMTFHNKIRQLQASCWVPQDQGLGGGVPPCFSAHVLPSDSRRVPETPHGVPEALFSAF